MRRVKGVVPWEVENVAMIVWIMTLSAMELALEAWCLVERLSVLEPPEHMAPLTTEIRTAL